MTLQPRILPTDRLTVQDRTQMFALMATHFAGLQASAFQRDLDAKQWVILLRDEAATLAGFTTVQLLTLEVGDTRHHFLFSGDTIVDPQYWNQPVLAGVFGHLLLKLMEERGDAPFYWFLITKGYRTYRFLPLNFKTFHPRHDSPGDATTAELLHRVAQAKFGPAYDAAAGIIRADAAKEHLRPALCTIPEGRAEDAHVRYFLARNPDFARGDELVCLTPLRRENITPLGWRQIERTHPVWELP